MDEELIESLPEAPAEPMPESVAIPEPASEPQPEPCPEPEPAPEPCSEPMTCPEAEAKSSEFIALVRHSSTCPTGYVQVAAPDESTARARIVALYPGAEVTFVSEPPRRFGNLTTL